MEKILKKYFPFFVLPTFLVFCIVFIIPFILGIGLSFTKFTTIFNSEFVGFQNYVTALSSGQRFGRAFIFTVLFTILIGGLFTIITSKYVKWIYLEKKQV